MRRFIAAGFGVGWIPGRLWGSDNGAGTFGAALGGIVGLALWAAPWWIDLTVAAAAVALSLWAAAPEAVAGADPGWVVIDEVAGALVAVIGLTGFPWAVAWVVARAGDIWKVLPGTARAETQPGALGVTLDDVVAGMYGLAAGWITASIL
jgi:phosphatidylglycerophosphatase A